MEKRSTHRTNLSGKIYNWILFLQKNWIDIEIFDELKHWTIQINNKKLTENRDSIRLSLVFLYVVYRLRHKKTLSKVVGLSNKQIADIDTRMYEYLCVSECMLAAIATQNVLSTHTPKHTSVSPHTCSQNDNSPKSVGMCVRVS